MLRYKDIDWHNIQQSVIMDTSIEVRTQKNTIIILGGVVDGVVYFIFKTGSQ